MYREPLDVLPLWSFFLVIGAVATLALEGGYRLGRWRHVWSHATAAAEEAPNPITAVFVQSLNDVIDVHAKRVQVGLRSRIPMSIWCGLFGLAFVGMAAIGYQAGLSATRRSPAMLLLVLAFAGVLFLIADLDRGQEGTLKASQAAMTDLQKSMKSVAP